MRRGTDPPRLSLTIQRGAGIDALPASRGRIRRWAAVGLDRPATLLLRFVGRAEGRALNRGYRGIDAPTNVLTFAYGDAPGEGCRADIVLCLPIVIAEARAQRKLPDAHLAHLVIHGVLHAQGWEHDTEAGAQAMEARERALLARFRIPDPYANGPIGH